jgi:hypothetical protein
MIEAGVGTESIAAILGIDKNTLYNRCKSDNNCDYSAFAQQNKAKTEHNLRAKQIEVALEGNPAMLIWLGKNVLNQSDKQEVTTVNDPDLVVRQIVDRLVSERGWSEEEARIAAQQQYEIPTSDAVN